MKTDDFKIEGLDQVLNALKELPDKYTIQFFKSFNRKVLNTFIINNLRSGTPYSAKTKSEFKVVSDRGADKTALIAGATKKVFFVRFVEGGTKVRETKKKANRGQIVGNGRMKNIIQNNIQPMIEYIKKELANDLDKFLQRKIKRLNK